MRGRAASLEEVRAVKARIMRMLVAGVGRSEISLLTGRSGGYIKKVAIEGRSAGEPIPRLRETQHKLAVERELSAVDTTPGCPRCSLRGEHECLPTRADAYLRQADGEWYADRRYR